MEGKKEYRERMWAKGLVTAEYTNVYIFIDCLCWVCIPGQFFCPKVEDPPFSVNRVRYKEACSMSQFDLYNSVCMHVHTWVMLEILTHAKSLVLGPVKPGGICCSTAMSSL